jgi:hypothetical protein
MLTIPPKGSSAGKECAARLALVVSPAAASHRPVPSVERPTRRARRLPWGQMLILPCGATPLPLAGRDNGSLTLVFVPYALRNPVFPRNAGPPFSVRQRKYKNGHSEKVPARWQTTPQKITFGEKRDGRVRRADLRLLKHTAAPSVPDSGSYEVRFPDGRESIYFYWDDNPGRRSITMALSSEEAEQKAKELARD